MRRGALVVCLLALIVCGFRGDGAAQSAAGPVTTANGSLRISVDAPVTGSTAVQPFLIGGWTLDVLSSSGSGMDAVHVWAMPGTGSPIFLGVAEMNVARPDVAASYGAQFQPSGFNLISTIVLSPGTYVLNVYGRR